MARATYLAPGVYVEEVPSAQQAVAGVGTNTVGFIGIVPDEIEHPVSNEDYDPEFASLALAIAGVTEDAGANVEKSRQRLADEINTLNEEIAREEEKIPGLEEKKREVEEGREEPRQRLEQELTPEDRESATNDLRRLDRALQRKLNSIQDLERGIAGKRQQVIELEHAMKGETGTLRPGEASVLKPYILKTHTVNVKPGQTKLCTNFTEYTNRFGPFSADAAYEQGKPRQAKSAGHRALTQAVYGFFQNGGTRCYVARVRNAAEVEKALENFEAIDAVAIIAAPGLSDRGTWSALVAHCKKCEDRFAILDCPADVEQGGELDIGKLTYDEVDNLLPQRNKNAAYYFPYIEVIDRAARLQDEDPARAVPLKHRGKVYVPPTGHVAGIYARTDEERGVHKAPANAAVLGAVGVKYYIGRPKQELLNPQGVNVIRDLNGNITVWGARTIGGDNNGEWKYVSVRRLFLFIRESIDESTQWVVFEPNDRVLWGKVRRNISAFLANVWRSGALFGSTPEEAFYVKCDDETNPPEVRELGQLVTEIGVAIVRPAEFVIFRISQSAGGRT